jgi:hypothetical protein
MLMSIGDVRTDVVHRYVESQLAHHRMADDRVQDQLAKFQRQFSENNLDAVRRSAHGQYIYNLHLVLEHDRRWCEVHEENLAKTDLMIQRVAKAKGHLLSRVSLFADHLHVALGCVLAHSPEDVALSFLNNLAYAHGMTPLFSFGYYAGTFGPIDMGAIWRAS